MLEALKRFERRNNPSADPRQGPAGSGSRGAALRAAQGGGLRCLTSLAPSGSTIPARRRRQLTAFTRFSSSVNLTATCFDARSAPATSSRHRMHRFPTLQKKCWKLWKPRNRQMISMTYPVSRVFAVWKPWKPQQNISRMRFPEFLLIGNRFSELGDLLIY